MTTFVIKTTPDGKIFGGALKAALEGFAKPMAAASTAAVLHAGEIAKKEARASIAANGFGAKWQNALRVIYYPGGLKVPSISSAAFMYHKIPYAGVFDEPTTIPGNPLLWIPIQGAAKSAKRPLTPRQMEAKGVKLFSMVGSATPLLGAKIKGSARSKPTGVSLAKLKRGTEGKRGIEQTVALFKGIPAVKLKKAFGVARIAEKQGAFLSKYYSAALKPDER